MCFQIPSCNVVHKYFTFLSIILESGDTDGLFAEYGDINREQQQRLLDTTEEIEQTGKHLANGYRIAIETEELGSKMLNDLHAQKETIQSSLNRVSWFK